MLSTIHVGAERGGRILKALSSKIKPLHRNHRSPLRPVDPLEIVTLDRPKKFTYISSLLFNEEREQLQLVLLNIIDVFSWSHSDMVGINPAMTFHKLNVIPTAKPVRRKSEAFASCPTLDYSDGGRQLTKRRFHQRSEVPRMAGQRGGGSKERR